MFEVIDLQLVANPIDKDVSVPALVTVETAKIQLAPVNKLKRGSHLLSDSEVLSEVSTPSKSGKKITKVKAKPTIKESSK